MARRPTRRTARRAPSRRSTPRGRYGRVARSPVRRSTRRSTARRAAPRQSRIVIEVVQPGAVRAGQPVDIGNKVAPQPRLKPRF